MDIFDKFSCRAFLNHVSNQGFLLIDDFNIYMHMAKSSTSEPVNLIYQFGATGSIQAMNTITSTLTSDVVLYHSKAVYDPGESVIHSAVIFSSENKLVLFSENDQLKPTGSQIKVEITTDAVYGIVQSGTNVYYLVSGSILLICLF